MKSFCCFVLALSFASSSLIAQTTTVYSYSVPPPTSTTGYAPNGNILSYSDSVIGSWTMQYDPLNRLQSAGATSGTYQGVNLQWTYDAWGNRLSQTPSGSSSAPVPIATSTGYGANNRPLSALGGGSPSFDGAGNSNFDGVNQVMYDPENRICAVYNSNVGGPITQYLYNAEGQRIAKGHPLNNPTVLACPNGTSNFVTTATYIIGPSGEQMTELDGSNQWKHTNVFAGGQLLATYDQQGLHFPITDPLGTVRVQVSGTGVTEQNCASLPYGDGLNCVGSIQDPTEHHFTGKERDTESGLDYFGARMYGSTMGRFMSPDPSGLVYADPTNPQSLNLYSYALNNPLKFTDPTGMYCYYGDPNSTSDGFDQTQFDYHSSKGECTKADENGNKGQWINDAYTHNNRDDAGRPDEAVSANSTPPKPGTDLVFDMQVAQSQQYLAAQKLDAAVPTSAQYLQAIKQTTGNLPNVCSFGVSALVGANRLGGGLSADTGNGVQLAGSVNLGHPDGYGPSYTLTGGANGNVSYAAPIPDTPFVAFVGTHNGDPDQIQSVGVGTRGKLVNVSVYANVGTFSQCK